MDERERSSLFPKKEKNEEYGGERRWETPVSGNDSAMRILEGVLRGLIMDGLERSSPHGLFVLSPYTRVSWTMKSKAVSHKVGKYWWLCIKTFGSVGRHLAFVTMGQGNESHMVVISRDLQTAVRNIKLCILFCRILTVIPWSPFSPFLNTICLNFCERHARYITFGNYRAK